MADGPDLGNGPRPASGRGAIHFIMVYTYGSVSTACEQAFPDRGLRIINSMSIARDTDLSLLSGLNICQACYDTVTQHWLFVPE